MSYKVHSGSILTIGVTLASEQHDRKNKTKIRIITGNRTQFKLQKRFESN